VESDKPKIENANQRQWIPNEDEDTDNDDPRILHKTPAMTNDVIKTKDSQMRDNARRRQEANVTRSNHRRMFRKETISHKPVSDTDEPRRAMFQALASQFLMHFRDT